MSHTLLVAHVYRPDRVSVELAYDGLTEDGAYNLTATHGMFVVRQIVNLARRPFGMWLRSSLCEVSAGTSVGPEIVPFKALMQAKRRFAAAFVQDDAGGDFALEGIGFGMFARGKLDEFAAASALAVAVHLRQTTEGTASHGTATEFLRRIADNAGSFTVAEQFSQTLELLSGAIEDHTV